MPQKKPSSTETLAQNSIDAGGSVELHHGFLGMGVAAPKLGKLDETMWSAQNLVLLGSTACFLLICSVLLRFNDFGPT